MEKWSIYFLLTGLLLFFLAGVVRRRQSAREKAEKVIFLRKQILRALEQIRTGNEDEVLAGLQTLTVLNDPFALLQAVPLIDDLRESANQRIAQAAVLTFEQLKSRLVASYDGRARPQGSYQGSDRHFEKMKA